MGSPSVIGPNGKDVYALSISFLEKGYRVLISLLVEALSREEAIGMGYRLLEKRSKSAKEIQINADSYLLKENC